MKCLSIGMNPNYVLSEEEKSKRFGKTKNKNPGLIEPIETNGPDVQNSKMNGAQHTSGMTHSQSTYTCIIFYSFILILKCQCSGLDMAFPKQETDSTIHPGATNTNIFIKPEHSFDDNIGLINNNQNVCHMSNALSPTHSQRFEAVAPATPTSVITSTQTQQNMEFPPQSRTSSIIVKNEAPYESLPSLLTEPGGWSGGNNDFSGAQLSSGSSVMSNTPDVDNVLDHNLIYNAFEEIVTAEFEESADADLGELQFTNF